MYPLCKLGKTPARHDARTLKLATYLEHVALPKPPFTCDWSVKAGPLGMLLNDSIGDCGVAAMGHMEQIWTGNAGKLWVPPDTLIETTYSALSGYVPGDDTTDVGTNLLDNLKYWRKTGIGGFKIGAFASLNIASQIELKLATWLFGGAYMGVMLPITAQDQPVWQVVPGSGINSEPNSWGGHCVNAIRYYTYPGVVSWGRVIPVTWEFYHRYFDEAYVIFSEQWLDAKDNAPNGFNKTALLKDLNAVTHA